MAENAFEARALLKKQISDPNLSLEEKQKLIHKLDRNPNKSLVRYRRRCSLTGRPRGIMYGELGRIKFRDMANSGQLPGIKKASW